MTHPRRHPLIWLALAAMLGLALLPTVSRALAHARSGAAAFGEVCTPQGLRAVALAAAPDTLHEHAAPLGAAGHWAHCPLCTLASDHPGLPPAPLQAAVPLHFSALRLQPAPQPPAAPPAWRVAQPRGPPPAA